MLTILIILLIIAALGGFGHTGYRRGWYGGGRAAPLGTGAPVVGGWGGGGLGLFLLIVVVLLLLFGHHGYGTY